jgi:hypothetical protein
MHLTISIDLSIHIPKSSNLIIGNHIFYSKHHISSTIFSLQVCKGGRGKDQLTPIMVIMIRPPILLLEMIHTCSHRLRTTPTTPHRSQHNPTPKFKRSSITYNRLIPPRAESLSLLLYNVLVKLELEGEEGGITSTSGAEFML